MGPKLNGGRGNEGETLFQESCLLASLLWGRLHKFTAESCFLFVLIVCLIKKYIRNARLHILHFPVSVYDSSPAQNPLRMVLRTSRRTLNLQHNGKWTQFSVLPQGQLLTPTLVHCGRETRSQFGTGLDSGQSCHQPLRTKASPMQPLLEKRKVCLQWRMKPCSGTRSQQLYETED